MEPNRILELCAEYIGREFVIESISFDNRNTIRAVVFKFYDGETARHPVLESENEKYVKWWKQSLTLLRKGLLHIGQE